MARVRQDAIREVGVAMQRYQRSVQAFDDAVGRALRVGPADMRCLDVLSEGPRTAGELAVATNLRPAATTNLIDRLADSGFVRRVTSSEDRRRVLVELTEEGQSRIWEAYGPLVSEGEEVFEGMTAPQIDAMHDVLDRMTALTERHRARFDGH